MPRSHDFRSRHRQRAHEEAHADSTPLVEQEKFDNPLIPHGPAELVETDDLLSEALDHLRTAGSFAYDSEFIGESSYHPVLCLIQCATTERVLLIDPLAEMDLKPFWELLADPSVEKIAHAGAQDVEPVFRLIGKPVANLLDTQIAAGFIALAYPTSLQKLTLELTGINLQKGLTFTDWTQRPLSSKQLRYAADDVRYLPAVASELKARLGKTNNAAWATEACRDLCEPTQYVFDAANAIEKVRGAGSLTPAQLNVLGELVIWRDDAARRHDLPARAFLKDEILVDICRNLPKREDSLAKTRGLPRPTIEQEGQTILTLIQRGLAKPTDGVESLRGTEATPAQKFAADTLWTAAQAICHNQSIDPAAVTSRQEIGELHRNLLAGEPIDQMRVMKGWRAAALGERLVSAWRNGESVNIRPIR
jgi:ribonuclease D